MQASVLCAQTTAPATQKELKETKEAKDETAVVKRGDLSTMLDFDGYFEPAESFEVRLRPKSYQGDLIIKSVAEPGTLVKKGDSLLVIDDTDIEKQLKAAENELTAAQANFAKAQADVQLGEAADALALKIQQTELSNAEAALKWWEQVDGAHMIKNAELSVKASRDSYEDQTDELEQLRKMYKSEELTSETADIVVKRALRTQERAKINQGMAEARETKVKGFEYIVARQKLVFAIEQQKQQLAELTAKHAQQAVTRKTALVTAQLALDKAQVKFDELKDDLAPFTVEAPFDGLVYPGEFNQGKWPAATNPKALRPDEKVSAGNVLMTLVPAGKLHLTIDVPESKLQFIEPGMKLRVLPQVAPDATTTGTVAAPSPVPVVRDNQPAYTTTVELDKLDPRLAAGQKAVARIDVERKDVLLVPSSAISKGRVKVKTSDGQTDWREVIVGHTDGDVTEIRDGLREGDEVFTKASGK